MASKTLMIQEDTYNLLVKLKTKNESFNDLILRLIYAKQDLDPFFGLLEEVDEKELDDAILEARDLNDKIDEERGDI
ncbi:MAG: antitoxin VapB family protein [Promethearchaeota archaeon]